MEAIKQKRLDLLQRKEAATRKNLEAAKSEDAKTSAEATNTVSTAAAEWKVYKAKRLKEKLQAEDAGIDWERHQALSYSLQECQKWQEQQNTRQEKTAALATDCGENSAASVRVLVDSVDFHAAGEAELQRRSARRKHAQGISKGRRPHPQLQAGDSAVGDYEDVTFINDVNRKFNQKVAVFYDKYTKEIAKSFERGTAI